ncbi:uncharacterized protein NECHADRAFT_85657 [Fusarium vanettenii 77-13-4]|uniref:Uncharacterized protein n=1 Tax=Fusarium vanettenii (strain ATCC MYA-4622 / CBS 123669 / FGSC 9596 / NRRL 45880 / 77-13-4) TaxID=660122 RepID=C7ZPB1_FUSV7|nr:uncharacterized protein NECHADRAFT_85657 [Fusarium vanettenii 77-13-4]EEU34112.1 predicted protein [Fusarium vanettenii 77-13-4]
MLKSCYIAYGIKAKQTLFISCDLWIMSRPQTPHGDDESRPKVRCNICGAEFRPGRDNIERRPDDTGFRPGRARRRIIDHGRSLQLEWLRRAASSVQSQPCTERLCDCIVRKVVMTTPKVVPTAEMGEGVVAITDYPPNDLMDELTGELAPPDTCQDG